jgi:hypothetical protein
MTSGGRSLLSRAEVLLESTRASLNARWKRTAQLDSDDREAARRAICDDFSASLRELAVSLLPALEGAMANRVPVELEPVLQRMANSAAPVWTSTVVLYAADAFNYSIERHDDPVTSLVPDHNVTVGEAPAGLFLFLRIPEIERDSATLHTIILGHELGHLRDWAFRLSANLFVPEPKQWCDDRGQLLLEHVADYRLYRWICHRWTGEIVADIVAASLFGPAALDALSELIGNLGAWRSDSSSHPAADRRAAVTLKVMHALGYSSIPALDNLLSHFHGESKDALTRPAMAADLPHAGPVIDLARKLVFQDIDHLIASCAAVISPAEFFEAARWPEVEATSRILASGFPYGEEVQDEGLPVAVDDAVIINAAWATRNDRVAELGKVVGLDASIPTEASQIAAVLDGLVLKSFEVAELRR